VDLLNFYAEGKSDYMVYLESPSQN